METALPAPTLKPVLQQTAARVQELEATAGDMLMRVEPDGTRATLADDLAAVRKEAAEGTDAELGALDADLVRVAAECAMSLGAEPVGDERPPAPQRPECPPGKTTSA